MCRNVLEGIEVKDKIKTVLIYQQRWLLPYSPVGRSLCNAFVIPNSIIAFQCIKTHHWPLGLVILFPYLSLSVLIHFKLPLLIWNS